MVPLFSLHMMQDYAICRRQIIIYGGEFLFRLRLLSSWLVRYGFEK